MKPEQIAKTSEHSHQAALFCWCALNVELYPELKWFHAIPNGGARGDDAKSRAIRGAALKAEGVKEGILDTFLPVKRGSWSGLYIEMKKPGEEKKKTGGLSPEQIEFKDFALQQGFGVVVCYSWIEARDVLIKYLEWKE